MGVKKGGKPGAAPGNKCHRIMVEVNVILWQTGDYPCEKLKKFYV
jgi:hypothetical protein